MVINELLKKATLAQAAFFVPSNSFVASHFVSQHFDKQQIDSICLVAQQTRLTVRERKLGEYDFFYATVGNYRLLLQWIEYGMLGFLFDESSGMPLVLDTVHSISAQFEASFREDILIQHQHDAVLEKYEKMKAQVNEAMGPMGVELIETLVKEMRINVNDPLPDELSKLAARIDQSARLIIGPSRTNELIERIKKALF